MSVRVCVHTSVCVRVRVYVHVRVRVHVPQSEACPVPHSRLECRRPAANAMMTIITNTPAPITLATQNDARRTDWVGGAYVLGCL
jgi:hypothetical protein